MKILYAGDGPLNGPAKYLAAVIRKMGAKMTHILPDRALTSQTAGRPFDVIVLSDYSASRVCSAVRRTLVRQVSGGAGLLMVGGWGSFSGPFGGWHKSEIEEVLPVSCLGRDDRLNFSSGACIVPEMPHPAFRNRWFSDPPVICGLNRVRPRRNARVILSARRIFFKKGPRPGAGLRPGFSKEKYPLLVMADPQAGLKTAALATDLAPHWCGGLVDWGRSRICVRLPDGTGVEMGNIYYEFTASLLRNLSKKG